MALPTFVVIGAAKSGTTALYNYLGQHPEVYMTPQEEPSFFAFADQAPRFRGPGDTEASVNYTTITSRAEYEELFAGAKPAQARGDISPVYLYWPGTAERLASLVPDVRIVAVLRHPLDRAYSAFMHACRESKEPVSDFRAALLAEPARIADNYGFLWRYNDLGRYAGQLRSYLEVFPREQVLITLYDDLAADPHGLCARVQDFIGVEPSFVPDTSIKHNMSGIPRSRMLYRLLRSGSWVAEGARRVAHLVGEDRLKRLQTRLRGGLLRREELDPALRDELLGEWEEEIQQVAALTGYDLEHWLRRKVPRGS